ncbi:MAG: DUF3857 domain-containing protein [Acidobacteria bacterium]|nr:DUF3857 domain-containing protein [Acidobacteriota bacterium]
MKRLGLALACGLVLCVAATPARAANHYPIEPGPEEMSAEEKAIVPDPSSGAEHAVVLAVEIEQDDAISVLAKTSYHLRAKILSPAGRALANVEIPLLTQEGSIKTWWGRTILPDGTVLSLPDSELHEEPLVRKGAGKESRVVKAVLKGVVPGAVIDYGYVLRDVNAVGLHLVPLQAPWPIRRLRYRWIPQNALVSDRPRIAACTLTHAEGADVKAVQEKKWFVVTARDLPAFEREPLAPSDDELRITAIFHYTFYARDPVDFWDAVAIEWSRVATLFCKPDRAVAAALERVPFPEGASLETKLRAAYDWLARRVRNDSLGSVEEMEGLSRRSVDRDLLEGVAGVFDRGAAAPWQIDLAFMGMARALGAEASFVLASDRREHTWNPSLLALDPFDEAVVAVHAPADPPDKFSLVDPGSGLPYGSIPFWISGGKALVTSSKGGRVIAAPASAPATNLSRTTGTIAIDAETGSARVRWSREGSGQKGLVDRRALRRLTPGERSKRLDDLCGASGDFDVSRADSPGLDDPAAPFRLECEGESARAGPASGDASISARLSGAWMEEVPELSAPVRRYPVVLPFPGIDRTVLDVASPAGFAPGPPPEPLRVTGAWGSYSLSIAKTAAGYHVERSLQLDQTVIPVASYDAFRRFLEEVRLADRTTLVFQRAEGGTP